MPEEMFIIYDTDCTDEPMFDRGFTGHEHLYNFGLINMNGRVYDPLMSSFLSPDNFIQCPGNPQNFNRYAYCLNNPLILTDPSGQETEEVETEVETDDWIYDIARDEYVWDETVKDIESTPEGFEYIGPTLDDVNHHFSEAHPLMSFVGFNPDFGQNRTPYSGELRDGGFTLEMWLDSPSENVGEGAVKVAANIAYGIINDPYTMIFGRTIGGREVTSNERVGAFANFVPFLITGGLVKTGQVIKTAGGLKGYNEFLKSTNKAGIHYSGTGWQKQAGKMYKMNKIANGSVDDFGDFGHAFDLIFGIDNEIKK